MRKTWGTGTFYSPTVHLFLLSNNSRVFIISLHSDYFPSRTHNKLMSLFAFYCRTDNKQPYFRPAQIFFSEKCKSLFKVAQGDFKTHGVAREHYGNIYGSSESPRSIDPMYGHRFKHPYRLPKMSYTRTRTRLSWVIAVKVVVRGSPCPWGICLRGARWSCPWVPSPQLPITTRPLVVPSAPPFRWAVRVAHRATDARGDLPAFLTLTNLRC